MAVNPEHTAVIQTSVPHEVADRLRECADEHDRSVAAEARRAIRVYLENSEAATGNGGSAKTRMAVRNESA